MICMERTLYHGSEFIIKKPEFLKGNIHKDYGIGFYCTTNKELAKEWAAKRSGKGYINKYILRDDRLKILDLTKPPFNDVLYWVSLLMHNRELSSSLKKNFPRELKYYFLTLRRLFNCFTAPRNDKSTTLNNQKMIFTIKIYSYLLYCVISLHNKNGKIL